MKLRKFSAPAVLTLSLACTLALPALPQALAKDPSTQIASGTEEAKIPLNLPDDFSTDLEVQSADMGDTPMVMKMYKLGAKQRIEMTVAGNKAVTLVDSEAQKMTVLSEDAKLATVMKMDAAQIPMNMDELKEQAKTSTYKEVGQEKIGEIDAIKYEVTDSKGEKGFAWMEKGTGYPVKFEAEGGKMTMQWKNLSPTKPDAALFEVPSGYRTLDMDSLDLNKMGEMLQNSLQK